MSEIHYRKHVVPYSPEEKVEVRAWLQKSPSQLSSSFIAGCVFGKTPTIGRAYLTVAPGSIETMLVLFTKMRLGTISWFSYGIRFCAPMS